MLTQRGHKKGSGPSRPMMLRAMALAGLAASSSAVPTVTTPVYLSEERPAGTPSTYEIKLLAEESSCEVVKAGWGQVHRLAEKHVYTTSVPDLLNEENGEDSADDFVQIFAPTAVSAVRNCIVHRRRSCQMMRSERERSDSPRSGGTRAAAALAADANAAPPGFVLISSRSCCCAAARSGARPPSSATRA
jgi:hypothetical protein